MVTDSPDAAAVRAFYASRANAPAWHDAVNGGLLPQAGALLDAIRESRLHGLEPGQYALARLAEVRNGEDSGDCGDQDAAMTRAAVRLATDLARGRYQPAKVDPGWEMHRNPFDAAAFLGDAIASGDIRSELYALTPREPGYRQLLSALATYRAIRDRGGWPQLDAGPTLRPGDLDSRVRTLRARLDIEGYSPGNDGTDPERFDQDLERTVRQFQTRHTLADDGLVGRATLAALNTPVGLRIAQIKASLERLRWLPREPGARYLLVNVPGFQLHGYLDGREVLSMPVIAGRPDRPTPSFADSVTRLVVNPYWDVPWIIAVKDLVPAQIRNPGYLASRHIHVLDLADGRHLELDPATLDWAAFRGHLFPYHLRQDPGPENAMGRIKFPLGNANAIYLHDTPERKLFQRATRALSSGCIRLSDALGLAGFLADGDPELDRQNLQSLIASGETVSRPLPRPTPLFVVYLTAWSDGDAVFFADDIYHRDGKLTDLLGDD